MTGTKRRYSESTYQGVVTSTELDYSCLVSDRRNEQSFMVTSSKRCQCQVTDFPVLQLGKPRPKGKKEFCPE